MKPEHEYTTTHRTEHLREGATSVGLGPRIIYPIGGAEAGWSIYEVNVTSLGGNKVLYTWTWVKRTSDMTIDEMVASKPKAETTKDPESVRLMRPDGTFVDIHSLRFATAPDERVDGDVIPPDHKTDSENPTRYVQGLRSPFRFLGGLGYDYMPTNQPIQKPHGHPFDLYHCMHIKHEKDGPNAEVRSLWFKRFDAAEAAKWPPVPEPPWVKVTPEEYTNLVECKMRMRALVKLCFPGGVWKGPPGFVELFQAFNPPREKNIAEVVK